MASARHLILELRTTAGDDCAERVTPDVATLCSMDGYTIGRRSSCSWILSSKQALCISRTHCSVHLNHLGEYSLLPLGRHPISVNGNNLPPGARYRLHDGDVIRLLAPEGPVISVVVRPGPARSAVPRGSMQHAAVGGSQPSLSPLTSETFQDVYDMDAEVLGSGGFAEVHKCYDKMTGQVYAVKVVDKYKVVHDVSNRSALGSHALLEEARILKSINHPNIVAVVRVFDGDPRPDRGWLYIVQELINDGELFNKIVTKQCFEEAKARGAFRQLCYAVSYLHSCGIVHRDLKPENILLQAVTVAIDPSGCDMTREETEALRKRCGVTASGSTAWPAGFRREKRYIVKVTDFGMARVIGPNTSWVGTYRPSSSVKVQRLKTIVGTDYYLAPEVDMRRAWSEYGHPTSSPIPLERLLESAHAPVFADAHPYSHFLPEVVTSVDALRMGSSQPPNSRSAARRGIVRCTVCSLTPNEIASLSSSANGGYDFAVDSFSLGVVLFVMLTGELPFYVGEGRPGLATQKLTRWYNITHPRLMECSPDLRDLITRLLQPVPQRRISPAEALEHPWLQRRSARADATSPSRPAPFPPPMGRSLPWPTTASAADRSGYMGARAGSKRTATAADSDGVAVSTAPPPGGAFAASEPSPHAGRGRGGGGSAPTVPRPTAGGWLPAGGDQAPSGGLLPSPPPAHAVAERGMERPGQGRVGRPDGQPASATGGAFGVTRRSSLRPAAVSSDAAASSQERAEAPAGKRRRAVDG